MEPPLPPCRIDIRFTAHVLAGHYAAGVVVTDPSGRIPHDVLAHAVAFEVVPAPGGAGLVDFVASTAVVDGPSLRLDAAAAVHEGEHTA